MINSVLSLLSVAHLNKNGISVINVFAAKWLVARLPDFQNTYPEIDIHLQTSNNVVDLQARTIDLAIRYGSGNYPGLEVCKLMSDVFTPVCSPRLLEGNRPLQTPHNLAAHALIHFEWINYSPVAPNWKSWLEIAGLNNLVQTLVTQFHQVRIEPTRDIPLFIPND